MNYPRQEFKKTLIRANGSNADIISGINTAFFKAVAQTRPMAQSFKGASRLASAFNVWSFVKTNIPYKKDPDSLQMIKLPSQLLNDPDGADCKSFTLLCGSLLANLGYPVVIRYVSYNDNPTPSHVYAYTFEKDGTPIICDAVHKKFNSELPYRSKYDCLMKFKDAWT